MPNTHKMATTPSKDLSYFQDGQWFWHSLNTTEFPYSKLTHSYHVTEDNWGTLPISLPQKAVLGVGLAFSFLVNLGLLAHNFNKARKIGKGNTKAVRKWLRLSASLAHIGNVQLLANLIFICTLGGASKLFAYKQSSLRS